MKNTAPVIKAMIFAAGRGTRLGELGLQTPKALIDLAGTPVIARIIEKLKALEIKKIIINVHHLKEQIIEFVNSQNYSDLEILFSVEDDLLETGGGLKQALPLIGDCDAVLIHNADVYSEVDLKFLQNEFFKQEVDALLCLQSRESSRVLLCDDNLQIVGWENHKSLQKKMRFETHSQLRELSFAGIHCVGAKFLARLAKYPRDAFSIMDSYFDQNNQDLIINGLDVTAASWFDLGTIEKIEKARKKLQSLVITS